MIRGIGIDAVDIYRFNEWNAYSLKKLRRIFSDEEITYCLKVPKKTAERFASRFAAREAFYKALSAAYPGHQIPFLTCCKAVQIHVIEAPLLYVQWDMIKKEVLKTSLSLTHTPTIATAFVILEQIS